MLEVAFNDEEYKTAELKVVLVSSKQELGPEGLELDSRLNGLLSKTLATKTAFTAKYGETKLVTAVSKDGALIYVLLVGLGNEEELESHMLEKLGGKVHKIATSHKLSSIGIRVTSAVGQIDADQAAAMLASGALLCSYRFDKYQTKKSEQEKFITERLYMATNNNDHAWSLFDEYRHIAHGVFSTRNFVSELPNILYPETYAERIIDELEPLDVKIDVLSERDMMELGMGAILGVGQGSSNESKIVVMQYFGLEDQSVEPVCFVGKGVTFDTGGISLKPSANMHEMKYDMAGSAAVVGAMKALAARKAKVNAVGIVGLVENMPGSNAQRPGDVVTTMSGQTAEVLNTDAEGRLVLCDCIWYAQEKFKPACIVDLATLTGAIVIALGGTFAGCFANDDDLAGKLIASGKKTDEKLWHMPLHKDFDAMINSEVADVANLGSERGAAGSATAAHFLGRFIQDGVKWAHLDIAGVAWDKKGTAGLNVKGASGYGVRLLNQFVKDNYEQN